MSGGLIAPLRAALTAAFDRRLDPASPAPLCVGLSGGSDSLALLVLTVEAAAARGRPVLALTVDHGLHPDSAAWTQAAGAQARALGADWRRLAWTGAKPRTGLPAAARGARHDLLAEAVRAAGASVLLLGHTADDVAEGEAMRRGEAPGLGRLREWSPSPAWPEGRGVFLFRPLLGVSRETLRREVLRARGLAWLDDPANADLRFARARARAGATRGAGPGLDPAADCEGREPLPSFGEREGWEDEGGEGAAGVVRLDLADLDGPTLSAALLCASGGVRPPRGAALARLLARLSTGAPASATLAGARSISDGARVRIVREPGRAGLPALPLQGRTIWDGRFDITPDVGGLMVAPLAGRAARLPARDRAALSALPAPARGVLPAILAPDGGVRLPRPFGQGPALARSLVHARLRAALHLIPREVPREFS